MDGDLKIIQSLKNNSNWLSSHFENIRKEHKNEFVVIKDGDMIKSGKNLNTLIASLRTERIKIEEVLIRFIPEKDLEIIL